MLRQADSYAVLRVVIRTGRMHQIRFHMSDAGYPLAGDPLYGDHEKDTSLLYGIRKGDAALDSSDSIGRTLLHAHRITLKHPESGRLLSITSPIPEDLKVFLTDEREKQE